MPYTLWSKGRLLGHTDLGFIANTDTTKMGWFHPTPIGEQIVDIITEPSRIMQSYRSTSNIDALRIDLAAASDRVAALELELRSPQGVAMVTDDISINDTERLLALAAEAQAELEEEVEQDEEYMALVNEEAGDCLDDLEFMPFDPSGDDKPWEESTFPRYQILVFF